MVTYFINEFKRKYKKDINGNAHVVRRLRIACELAKGNMSSSANASIEVDQLYDSIDFYMSISLARFEELCIVLFKQTITPVEHVLQDAKLDKGAINDVFITSLSACQRRASLQHIERHRHQHCFHRHNLFVRFLRSNMQAPLRWTSF